MIYRCYIKRYGNPADWEMVGCCTNAVNAVKMADDWSRSADILETRLDLTVMQIHQDEVEKKS